MEGSSAGILRLWDRPRAPARDGMPPAPGEAVRGPHYPAWFAARLYACEALTGPAADGGPEPYRAPWFLEIERQRYRRHGRWMPRVLEFHKHSGETLLALGTGLGTDWVQYARHGSSVVVCSPSREQLALCRANFEAHGLAGRFLHAAPHCLPLASASIDVVCVTELLEQAAAPAQVINEVYRVLKPGGKVLAVVPARFDVNFWFYACFPWLHCLRPASQERPPNEMRFSASALRRLFQGFTGHRISKRHLRRSEVPHLWRWVPRPLMERLMGRRIILKAIKPLSSVLPLSVAA